MTWQALVQPLGVGTDLEWAAALAYRLATEARRVDAYRAVETTLWEFNVLGSWAVCLILFVETGSAWLGGGWHRQIQHSRAEQLKERYPKGNHLPNSLGMHQVLLLSWGYLLSTWLKKQDGRMDSGSCRIVKSFPDVSFCS